VLGGKSRARLDHEGIVAGGADGVEFAQQTVKSLQPAGDAVNVYQTPILDAVALTAGPVAVEHAREPVEGIVERGDALVDDGRAGSLADTADLRPAPRAKWPGGDEHPR
jgi:hypothetical protein